jgi:hypothetical protein
MLRDAGLTVDGIRAFVRMHMAEQERTGAAKRA